MKLFFLLILTLAVIVKAEYDYYSANVTIYVSITIGLVIIVVASIAGCVYCYIRRPPSYQVLDPRQHPQYKSTENV